jgi:hypothetical protein
MKLAGQLIMLVLVGLPVFARSQTLNFSGKNIPLKEMFKIIRTQTGLLFFYDCTLLKDAKAVTVIWKDIPVGRALDECFKTSRLPGLLKERQ